MKTIKPQRLSAITRPYQFTNTYYLGVTVFVLWDFQEGKPIAEGEPVFVKQVVRFLMQLIRHFSLTRYSPSMGLARPL